MHLHVAQSRSGENGSYHTCTYSRIENHSILAQLNAFIVDKAPVIDELRVEVMLGI